MILPLGLAACIPVIAALGDEERGAARRFDFVGFILIAVAVGCIQLVFDRGQREDWFESEIIVIETALAVACLYFFVVHASFARFPLFDAATFRDRNFVLGVGFALVMGMLQYTPMVLFPAILTNLQGYPESVIGYLIAMRGVGNFLSFLVVAQLTRLNAEATLAAGLLIQAAAGFWMASLDMNMSSSDVALTNLIHGFGFGLAYTPMAALTFSTLDVRLLTQGNAIFSLLRMLGSSMFISIVLVVFVQSAAAAQANLVEYVTLFDRHRLAPWIAHYGELDTARFQALAAEQVRRQAAMIGYVNAFYLLTLAPAIAAPAVLLFKRRPKPAL